MANALMNVRLQSVIPIELAQLVDTSAKENCRSTSKEIEYILRQYFKTDTVSKEVK